MEAEMDEHLGYGKSERVNRDEQSDYRVCKGDDNPPNFGYTDGYLWV